MILNSRPIVAFDIGGTFTDIVALRPGGGFSTWKVRSDPAILLPSVLASIDALFATANERRPVDLLHATTLASNALLEGRGAKVGLLTTAGFRDELEIRRESRPAVYDFQFQRIPPLIPRRRRLEVQERIDATGQVVIPLGPDDVETAILRLQTEGIEALAICFINAHVNPVHEVQAQEVAARLLPDIPISASHEVLPEMREYERCSTTSVNAYVMPTTRRYLDDLEGAVSGRVASLRIMQSNGGMMSPRVARHSPVRMTESGPAAGALAASMLAREKDLPRAVAFDMGGTTVKACLIEDGIPVVRYQYEVGGEAHAGGGYDRGAGYSISIPSLDIVEAGAGGGSIAQMQDGLLRVGPRSAGAVPGPAAYENGGTEATVTDANVVLGYISPRAVAGGTVAISVDAAKRAVDAVMGTARSSVEGAYGIFHVANAMMMRTIRAVTTARGRDPRDFTLIAFGGSGPIHAAPLAELLGMTTVCIPPHAGLFSAVGLLLADLRYDFVESWSAVLDASLSGKHLLSVVERLVERARRESLQEGIDTTGFRIEQSLDLRYANQSVETVVALPTDVAADTSVSYLQEKFHAQHEEMYGYRRVGERIQIVNLRVSVLANSRKTSLQEIARDFFDRKRDPNIPVPEREAYFGPQHGMRLCRVIDRHALVIGTPTRGPLIIEEQSSTTVVPPEWEATLDASADLVLRRVGA
jgi:N-methylhydantoinase A